MENTLMEEYRELNEVERKFKEIFLRHPERRLDSACAQESVEDVLKEGFACLPQNRGHGEPALSNEIPEGTFIAPDMDCGFVRHMRYMPAYWHTHEFFELLIVLSGSCVSTFPDEEVTLRAGDVCIQAPGTSHAVSAFRDSDILINVLIRRSTFEHAFIGVLDTDTIVSGFFRRAFTNVEAIPWLIFHAQDDPVLPEDLSRALSEMRSAHRYRRQMVNAVMTELFLHLLERHEKDLEAGHVALRESSENLMYILRYMQENCTTISLHELASFFHYSDRQMQRILRSATGATFTENIRRQRMHLASDLLLGTRLPVSIIAEKCGFDSPNNFRRTFRALYGDTPQNFRAAHAGQEVIL